MLSCTISRRKRRAALAGGPDRRKQDRTRGELEVRARADDRRIVAAELEQHSAEALRNPRPDFPAHGGRSRGGHQRDARIVDELLSDVPLSLDKLDQARQGRRRTAPSRADKPP